MHINCWKLHINKMKKCTIKFKNKGQPADAAAPFY